MKQKLIGYIVQGRFKADPTDRPTLMLRTSRNTLCFSAGLSTLFGTKKLANVVIARTRKERATLSEKTDLAFHITGVYGEDKS